MDNTTYVSLLTNGVHEEDGVNIAHMSKRVKEFWEESKKLWKICGPAILTAIFQYLLDALTQTFVGHVGELELAAVSVEQFVITGFSCGIMMGMGSALETLCGQAYGVGKLRMMSVYMQRSWIILIVAASLLLPLYIWSTPILILFGSSTEISKAAGKFALWMIPQVYAYAFNYPIQKFLQGQRKMMVMTCVAGIVLVFHALFSWLLIVKLGLGLAGAAITLNTSWWLLVIGQLSYILVTKSDSAWFGLSFLAFSDLFGFLKLSLASGFMLCLEFWYMSVLLIIAGRLTDPLVSLDALSICLNIYGLYSMIAKGFNTGISVRVSNELGAGKDGAAKYAIIVVSITSITIGAVCSVLVFSTREYFPYLFTTTQAVAQETTKLAVLLAFLVFINGLQPILSGVAVGAGWQPQVGYINTGCYYFVGVPLCILLGFTFNFGVEGIWSGIIAGTCLQMLIMLVITVATNWAKQVEEAGKRLTLWGGTTGEQS